MKKITSILLTALYLFNAAASTVATSNTVSAYSSNADAVVTLTVLNGVSPREGLDPVSFTGTFTCNSPDGKEIPAFAAQMDYGDGTVVNLGNYHPGDTIPIDSKIYTYNGNYTAVLTLTGSCDADGGRFSYNDKAIISVMNVGLEASITPTSATLAKGESVTFTAYGEGLNKPLSYVWSTCSGEEQKAVVSYDDNIASCTVTVTDVDGDSVSRTATISYEDEPAPDPDPEPSPDPSPTPSPFEDEEEVEPEQEVLGETVCESTVKMSGYVYVDENGNGEYDDSEAGPSGVTVKVYTKDEDDEMELYSKLTTGTLGYYKGDFCTGEYVVELDTETLPESTKLTSDSEMTVIVEEDMESIDFILEIIEEEKKGMGVWVWVIVVAVLMAIGGGAAYYFLVMKKKEDKDKKKK